MATRSPASVRRSGCWAVKAAAIQRAFMRGLLQRESVDGATGAGRGVFHDRASGWMGEGGQGLRANYHRPRRTRSEEHTSELQSPCNLVCRLLLEKKKKKYIDTHTRYVTHAS